jgi:hypothetical protein
MRLGGVAVIVCAAALAGCLGDEDHDALEEQAMRLLDVGNVRLEAYDCHQAGGNSVYAMTEGETKVGPFYTADQRAEVGDPLIGAYGQPVLGPANGIWHVATNCRSYTFAGETHDDFGMGWVAQMIERPDFDVWGEPRIQFLVADLSFSDEAFVAALKVAALGAEISPAYETSIEWIVSGSYMRVIITEANHGTFDFSAELHKEFTAKENEHIRFWMLPRVDGEAHDHGGSADADGVLYRPIAIDIHDRMREGPTPRLAGESIGTFTHLPDGHVGNPLGHFQYGFDRVIEIGPVPADVVFDETWLH